MTNESNLHIFGIRHHGPGSARSVLRALEALKPDVILVEGPPDAEAVLPLLAHADMTPPVALLIYVPETPRRAVYYPFAVFSPEWQAIHFGLTHGIPVRFMDLPQAYQLAAEIENETFPETPETVLEEGDSEESEVSEIPHSAAPAIDPIHQDPIGVLAGAAGYADSERWWEHMVEQRQDGEDVFAAIQEAVAALREEAGQKPDPREAQREAYMRQTIRAAQKEGFDKIAVVCGAWHAPVLARMPQSASQDKAILAGLPKTKVAATWVPWTNGRLTYASGYGAGIESPGWYHHLWTYSDKAATYWMARVAHLLREQDLDASPAHIIEAVRLSVTLAALRGRSLAGLPEMNEAVQSIFCFGSDLPLRLIGEKLIVGEALGRVPEETPTVPLQQDLERLQRRLRLPAEATQRALDLDLRKDTDLERSHLLHRLNLLQISWGKRERAGGVKGTFHEIWRVQWQPEFAIAIIEVSVWGNTVLDAAEGIAADKAQQAGDLPLLTKLLDNALLAELPKAVHFLMNRLADEAALASDTGLMMDALPPLVNVVRYGNVRRTDATMVRQVVDGLITRIAIGLPSASASLNDEAAAAMFSRLQETHSAIALLQDSELMALWQEALAKMSDQSSLHGLVAGRICRILLDAGRFTPAEASRRLGLALSIAGEPAQAAAWVEGFLKGSGQLLLHDEELWQTIDAWVAELHDDSFTPLLPLLRRTFSTFTQPERRQIGERARHGAGPSLSAQNLDDAFDEEQAKAALPLVAQLLGL